MRASRRLTPALKHAHTTLTHRRTHAHCAHTARTHTAVLAPLAAPKLALRIGTSSPATAPLRVIRLVLKYFACPLPLLFLLTPAPLWGSPASRYEGLEFI